MNPNDCSVIIEDFGTCAVDPRWIQLSVDNSSPPGVNLLYSPGEIKLASLPGLGSICNLITTLETNNLKASTISPDIPKAN